MSEVINLIKSDNDKKQYQYHVLPNGLKVLLIHDPDVADALHHQQNQDGTSDHVGGQRCCIETQSMWHVYVARFEDDPASHAEWCGA
jgi:hypothetical protein